MKCPYCGQEHPDSFQFCPVTGQRIASQFKACTNEQCSDFGKYILPLESKFCPSCGQPLIEQATESKERLKFTINGVSFTMILVEHGNFMMGATQEQEDPNYDEEPIHKVMLTKDYYIGETPVTQSLWKVIMNRNPSEFGEGGEGDYVEEWENLPVENVTWNDCQLFVNRLNMCLHQQLNNMKFRLPTEAEWEFAARGGKESCGYQYSGSNYVHKVAWYENNTGYEGTHPVAKLIPNELGIYDMSGNVWEWCQDWFDEYQEGCQINPNGPNSGWGHVVRGGCWRDCAGDCRVSCRWNTENLYCGMAIGLRLVLFKMTNNNQGQTDNSKKSRKKQQSTNEPECNNSTAELTIGEHYVIGKDCIACGTCIDECPEGAIQEGNRYYIDPQKCSACGTCADVCPSEAISFEC